MQNAETSSSPPATMTSTVSTVSPTTSPKPVPSLLKEDGTIKPPESEDSDLTPARDSLDDLEHKEDVAETKPASPPPTKPANGIIPTTITVFSADSPYSELQSLPPTSPPANGITDPSFASASSARPSSIIISGNDHSHSYGFINHSPGHSPSQTSRTPSYLQDNASSVHTQKPAHTRNRSSVSTDLDAQEMVISSLRQQILDLSTQVSQLNSKLITSYDRVSDLEDSLHVSTTQFKSSKTKIQELEVERSQHLSALNTGLLVEKSHVTSELTRLMDKATEEAAQRGRAEDARFAIEKDLDDLSAQLFGQANSMVAEARFQKHLSERKVEEAEKALKGAEDAVRVMQMQMQTMLEEKEKEEKEKEKERERNNGWGIVRRTSSVGISSKEIKLLRVHAPYQDYMAFIAHLRLLHLSTQSPPAMSTLLPLPFLARLLTEDSEPTVRLDLAPSLNWLSRRSVLSAIHSGQLRIEPISITTLLNDPNTNINPESVSCALCGCPLFPSTSSSGGSVAPGNGHQHTPSNASTASSWSTAGAAKFFRKPSLQLGLSQNSPSSPTATPSLPPFLASSANLTQGRRTSTSAASLLDSQPHAQVFIFRLSTSANTGGSSLPVPKSISASSSSSTATPSTTSSPYSSFPLSSISLSLPSGSSSSAPTPTPPTSSHQHTSSLSQSTSTIYPLCTSSWCLARLRTTCILWAFVRTGIVERVWEEELPEPAPLSAGLSGSTAGQSGGLAAGKMERSKSATTTAEVKANGAKSAAGPPPPVPPRRRGLWSLASAIGERAASWGDKDKEKKSDKVDEESTSDQVPSVPTKDAPTEVNTGAVQSAESTASTAPATASPVVQVSTSKPAAQPTQSPTSTSAPPSAPPPIPPRRADIRTHASTPPPAPPRSPIRGSSPSSGSPLRASSPSPKLPIRASSPLATTNSKTAHTRNASLSTAIGVPLPPSRPGTPQALAPAAGAVGPTISRPTTPQSGTTAPVVGGSPAPPPIPRRAAARTRVVAVAEEEKSVEETKDEEKKDLEASDPAVVAEVVKEEKQEKGEDGTIEISDSEDDDDDKVSVTTAPDEVALASSPVEKTVESTAEEDKKDTVVEKGDEKKEEEIEQVVELTKTSTKVESEEVAPSAAAQEKPSVSTEATEASESSRPSQEISTEPQSITSRTSLAEDEEVNPNYTSDVTWEERTWREVVRLREDMFWARVGGVKE